MIKKLILLLVLLPNLCFADAAIIGLLTQSAENPELVTNGSFDDSTGWTTYSGWAYNSTDKDMDFDDSITDHIYSTTNLPSVTNGVTYVVGFSISACATTAYFRIVNTTGSVVLVPWQDRGNGDYTGLEFTATGTGDLTRIYGSTARDSFTLDNLSIKVK